MKEDQKYKIKLRFKYLPLFFCSCLAAGATLHRIFQYTVALLFKSISKLPL